MQVLTVTMVRHVSVGACNVYVLLLRCGCSFRLLALVQVIEEAVCAVCRALGRALRGFIVQVSFVYVFICRYMCV